MSFLKDFLSDIFYAGRTLRRSPRFAVLAILVMALGIAANTAVFSVVNGVVLKPLPYPGSERIVTLRTALLAQQEINPLINLANFRDWFDRSTSFEAMTIYRGGESPVSPGGAAEYGQVASVDIQFFRVFAVQPSIGRTFVAEEMVPGSGRTAVVISHQYWQTRYAGDPGILQRTIFAGPNQWPIVGVMPPGFQFPNKTDIWFPLATASTSRTNHSFFGVGRLKPEVQLERAQAELTAIAAALEQQYPDSNKGRGAATMYLRDQMVGDVRLTLYLLWGVVAMVLLIACANTATFLLSKATARMREIAVRAAMGASRRRIVRQLITESLLLAVIAGGFGLLLAMGGTDALVALAPAQLPRLAEVGIDGGVLAFTFVISLATSFLFGLFPALYASKLDLTQALKLGGSRSVTGGRMIRMRGLLVVFQIALAVVLLTGAGLLTKSLFALHSVDLGYQPENVLVMKATGVTSKQEHDRYFQDVISRVAALPGVLAVGAMSTPPGDLSNAGSGGYFIDRMPETRDRSKDPFTYYTIIAPGTFEALNIPLKSGRDFNDGDTLDRPMVAIVNEALVRNSFGGVDPIGRTIICPFDTAAPMTIVGVVGDVRQLNPAIEPVPDCYMPYRQHAYNGRTLHVVVRTAGDPAALAPAMRDVAVGISPNIPVSFRTMETIVSERVQDPTFRALLFGLFAALAVCLAMAGVYGVMAYAVEQRSNEIGLRMALGASRNSVLRLILSQGMLLTAIGLAIGFVASIAATRLLRSVLFEVQPVDPQVYLGVTVLLGVVTLVASYLPARRAAVLDPADVLKME